MSITKNNKILASDISTALNNKQDKLNYTPVKSVIGVNTDEDGNMAVFGASSPNSVILSANTNHTMSADRWIYCYAVSNTIVNPTIKQLAIALRKAGETQTSLWTKPYES